MGQINMKDDRKIHDLADRFVKNKIGILLKITFEMYLENTEYYDELFDALDQGHGLHLSEAGELMAVEIGR